MDAQIKGENGGCAGQGQLGAVSWRLRMSTMSWTFLMMVVSLVVVTLRATPLLVNRDADLRPHVQGQGHRGAGESGTRREAGRGQGLHHKSQRTGIHVGSPCF